LKYLLQCLHVKKDKYFIAKTLTKGGILQIIGNLKMERIIAVDISGRHRHNSRYLMVCAAVSLSVSGGHVKQIHGVNIKPFVSDNPPEVVDVVQMIERTVEGMEGVTIVAEEGDFFNQPEWLSNSMFTASFKYPESLSERMGIEIAHHISLSSRNLLLDPQSWELIKNNL
jgi:hypothetical protein